MYSPKSITDAECIKEVKALLTNENYVREIVEATEDRNEELVESLLKKYLRRR
jgi:hypothetical protein